MEKSQKQEEIFLSNQYVLSDALRDTASILNSTLDIDEVLLQILITVEHVVPHDAVNIMLFEDNIARVVSQRGYEIRGISDWMMNVNRDVDDLPTLRRITQSHQPYLIQDTSKDTNWTKYPETSWIKSHLGVPIRRNEEVIGVINLDSDKSCFFNDAHAKDLLAFSDQVSTALRNATLYQEAVKAAERRATLHQVSQEIIKADHSTERVYQAIHKAASKLMPCEAFAIALTGGEEGNFEAVYNFDNGVQHPKISFPVEGSLTSMIIKSGESIIIDDLAKPDSISTIQLGDGSHIRSLVAAPIRINGSSLGMISAQSYSPNVYTKEDQRLIEMLAAYASTSLESSRLFEEVKQHAKNQEDLNRITQIALIENNPEEALDILADHLKEMMKADNIFITVWDEEHGDVIPAAIAGGDSIEYSSLRVEPGEITLTNSVLEARHTIGVEDIMNSPFISRRIASLYPSKSIVGLPLIADERKLGAILVAYNIIKRFTTDFIDFCETTAAQISLALANILLLNETSRRATELEAVAKLSYSLRLAESVEDMPPIILDHLIKLLEADGAALAINTPGSDDIVVEFGQGTFINLLGFSVPQDLILNRDLESGQAIQVKDFLNDPLFSRKKLITERLAIAYSPLIAQGRIVGVLIIGKSPFGETGNADFTYMQLRLLSAIGDIAANALHRAELFHRTNQQLEHMSALHDIDMAISGSFDLHFSFNTILVKILNHLKVDAASILLMNKNTHTLDYEASLGFHSERIKRTSLKLGEPHAGKAVLDHNSILVDNLAVDEVFANHPLVSEEGFVSYYAIPLKSKGKVNGVLELFNRTQIYRDPEWFKFVRALATQASIAINNHDLFSRAERSNLEHSLAYDETILGWAKTLELRDIETEGHCQRVSQKAIQLAKVLGISGTELIYIRRGALLHDIGKIGVPDSILFKPGSLTDDEWEIMKQHPINARNLLRPIPFLRPSVDIPYSHHEKWDGTGYPIGLKAEHIPLSARIFAVIDVWDALINDRPYRQAWSIGKVKKHIQEQSGRHFDPKVVKAFLELI